ncbi:endonuclease NucS [Empedobacter falsenii]
MKKLITMLEELKSNFSDQLFRDTLEEINNIQQNSISQNFEEFRKAINGQVDQFYDEIAYIFKEDFELNPLLYLIAWEELLSSFEQRTLDYFFESCKSIDYNTDFTDMINGLIEFNRDNLDVAILHFNRIEHEIVHYFLGLCYFELENDENAIKQNKLFLNYLNDIIPLLNQEEMTDGSFNLLYWNIYIDLAYSYIITQEYQNALECFSHVLKIFSLEQNYSISSQIVYENGVNDFEIFINNYLVVLEKTRNYRKAVEVLEFVLSKLKSNHYYRKLKEDFIQKIEKNKDSEDILQKLFKPKKPFEISQFHSLKLLSKEKSLEDMIVEQIKYGINVFGKELEIYQDDFIYGRQYRIPEINGILDLLLIEKSTNQLYVVELKRNEAGVEVVQQIENYITALSTQLNRNIKGIICLHQPNQALIDLVKTKDMIELFTYSFEFNQL